MPLLWKYLILDYLKVLTLCVISFVAILLTLRFDEIAHFACLGSSWGEFFLFIALQLPYLLPIALPFSALIASYLLYSRLSQRQELTAMRASGLSLTTLLAPILITSAFLSLANFYITSEAASTAHLLNGQLRHTLRTVNPLLLLQNKRLLMMQGIYCETLGTLRHGEFASDIFFAIPDRQNHRIALLIAKSIRGSQMNVEAKNITFATSYSTDKGFDSLAIENIAELETPFESFTPALQQKTWILQPDHLRFNLLLQHIEEQKRSGTSKMVSQGYSEIGRRISISLSLFIFTLMGAAFSMHIGRQRHRWDLIVLAFLAGSYLVCHFLAKSFSNQWTTAIALYMIPSVILVMISCWKLRQIQRGVE